MIKILYDEVYDVNLVFVTGCSTEDAINKVEKLIGHRVPREDDDIALYGFMDEWFDEPNFKRYYIFFQKDPLDITTTVHETVHLAFRVFNNKGIEISDSEEPFAYYIDFWFRKITEAIQKEAYEK